MAWFWLCLMVHTNVHLFLGPVVWEKNMERKKAAVSVMWKGIGNMPNIKWGLWFLPWILADM